jgi:hypothetical protein
MWQKLVDKALDKMQTPDFWRGVVYLVAAVGVQMSPDNAALLVTGALGVSGLLHTWWHKTHA